MKILIVSSEPELYRISFFDVLNQAVHVTDQAVKGLTLMNSHAIDKVFVSYAQMDNKWNDRAWSGQTFVRELPGNTGAAEVAQAIIDVARRLNLKVNAEGVETSEQSRYLVDASCHELQGFLFSKPLSVTELEKLLERQFPRRGG